jgi:hypothetical protein
MKTQFVRLLDTVLGCRHPEKALGWPRIDIRRGHRAIYKPCLRCGTRVPYHNDELIPGSEEQAAA